VVAGSLAALSAFSLAAFSLAAFSLAAFSSSVSFVNFFWLKIFQSSS
jgi:hypothetical protein